MKLSLHKETLLELTADELSSVVGGDSDSCSCTIASCVTNDFNVAIQLRLPAAIARSGC